MKLKWTQSESHRWLSEGKHYSYAVLVDPASRFQYRVLQMRQQGGQIVNSNATLSLTGAQARAQVWEDDAS